MSDIELVRLMARRIIYVQSDGYYAYGVAERLRAAELLFALNKWDNGDLVKDSSKK